MREHVSRRPVRVRSDLLGLAAVLLGCAFGMLPGAVTAQQAAVQGIVTSAGTGSPLEGVSIVLEAGGREAQGTLTDRNGFYQLRGIEPGTYTLRARNIGYREHQQSLTLARNERRTVSLRLEDDPVVLQGIVVTAPSGAAVRDLGRQRVTPIDLRMVPVPAGAGDLASYLQTLPGVATTGDRGGQVFVRGGTPAENLALVDGIPIFQPFHILGFFSVFPEDLVSSVDFYAGGYGARYHDRTSSVLDVHLRDGNPNEMRAMGSLGPFVAEALVEGPVSESVTWLASVRRSLVEETSGTLLGSTQPLTFDSQLLKLTATGSTNNRCSALALRTSDRGRFDPDDRDSYVAWQNLVAGLRCIKQLERAPQLLEVSYSFTRTTSEAASRGSSSFSSSIWKMQHAVHATSMLGSVPLHAGYHLYLENMRYDLAELFGMQASYDAIFGASAYAEADLSLGSSVEVRPGMVFVASPRPGLEPRLRAGWEPFGAECGKLEAAFGLYRQNLTGTSDMRDVSSVFGAWMSPQDGEPLEALHGLLGWQQSLGGGLRWSVEGYYKRMRNIPVPKWSAEARFTTTLTRAAGRAFGADTRVELRAPHFYGFVGYGYSWTEYETEQDEFAAWFGDPVQRYHPPHDRRHQLNAVAKLDLGEYHASARWQLGTGLPFTRPMGFHEGFDFTTDLHDVRTDPGRTQLLLERPFTGRLPVMHRLDLSLERGFDTSFGRLQVQAGAINAYDRRNMFYYDLFSGRRADQLPLAPYFSFTLRSRNSSPAS